MQVLPDVEVGPSEELNRARRNEHVFLLAVSIRSGNDLSGNRFGPIDDWAHGNACAYFGANGRRLGNSQSDACPTADPCNCCFIHIQREVIRAFLQDAEDGPFEC